MADALALAFGAGEFAGALGAGEVAALGAGEVAAFGAGEVAAFDAGGVAAFGAGEAAGEAPGPGLVLEGGGAFWSSDGARLPMFARSGPTLILPSKAGRSKI
jgi:hypothetical protein